jgi:hypothetical protein
MATENEKAIANALLNLECLGQFSPEDKANLRRIVVEKDITPLNPEFEELPPAAASKEGDVCRTCGGGIYRTKHAESGALYLECDRCSRVA